MTTATTACSTQTCELPVVLNGGNALAFSIGDKATATCTCEGVFDSSAPSCSESYTAEFSIPVTVTNKVTGEQKNITFTSSYDCTQEGTCDYSVPYDCNYDGTCPADCTLGNTCAKTQQWVDCKGGSDKTCGFTVKDMTVPGSVKLQNPDLNNGNYASMSLTTPDCPSMPLPKFDPHAHDTTDATDTDDTTDAPDTDGTTAASYAVVPTSLLQSQKRAVPQFRAHATTTAHVARGPTAAKAPARLAGSRSKR